MTIHDIQNQLNTIENIATAYTIETDKIKTKNNLIF